MIAFWATCNNSEPVIAWMAATPGSEFRAATLLFRYEDWLDDPASWQSLPQALHVLTDIEFLSGAAQQQAQALHGFLSARGRVLNHPGDSLKRLALHQRLAAEGINDFRSFQVGLPLPAGLQFPVFLRRADDHKGSRSTLLADRNALDEQLAELARQAVAVDEWIVTEYRETADAEGLRHKYAAMIIDGAIVPRHLFFSREWMIKEAGVLTPALLETERRYLQSNPHREPLERIAELAGIRYGRIDYGLVDGRVQVWEINTNPMVFRPRQWVGPRTAHQRRVREQIERAWQRAGALSPVTAPSRGLKRRLDKEIRQYLVKVALYLSRRAISKGIGRLAPWR